MAAATKTGFKCRGPRQLCITVKSTNVWQRRKASLQEPNGQDMTDLANEMKCAAERLKNHSWSSNQTLELSNGRICYLPACWNIWGDM
eukprot:86740-Amphidinium_carterae.1